MATPLQRVHDPEALDSATGPGVRRLMLGVRPTVRRFRTRPFGGCAAGVKFYGTVCFIMAVSCRVPDLKAVQERAKIALDQVGPLLDRDAGDQVLLQL